jgi:hypothetical protein
MDNDLDNIYDLFSDNIQNEHEIKSNETQLYYTNKAESILHQMQNNDTYFIFLKTFIKKYHELNSEQKQEIIQFMDIKPKIEKVFIKQNNTKKKNNKPKLCNYDDY